MSMYLRADMNLKEIAAVLKVTESRVCQLHSQSIARLRSKLRAWRRRSSAGKGRDRAHSAAAVRCRQQVALGLATG